MSKVSVISLVFICLFMGYCTPVTKEEAKETKSLEKPDQPDVNYGSQPKVTFTPPDFDEHAEPFPLDLSGYHGLTLQWIGWEKRGKVFMEKGNDGWFNISGKQSKGEDFISIEGKIRPKSKLELIFRGEIVYRVASLNQGDSCIKKGRQVFKSTQNRKYWRMQDMASCEHGITDYIDIYF